MESTGREALTELRRLLDLLGDDQGPTADLAPHPTLADLDAMVGRLRDAAVPVALHVEGQPSSLPDGLGAAAYRIVQEALTNAMKHAAGASTNVVVSYVPHAVVLDVVDEGSRKTEAPATSPGRGLAGMRERAEQWGGTVEAGPWEGHGFKVRARLPFNQASG